ncbi:MAG: ATP-binding cassette domain-containing protein [Sneathiellaceae bacterium]
MSRNGQRDAALADALQCLLPPDALPPQEAVRPAGPAEEVPDGVPEARLQRLADHGGFRWRAIALPPGWWRQPGPPMLLWQQGPAGLLPVAALWQAGAWRLAGPPGHRPGRLGAAQAAACAPTGHLLYPALPAGLAGSAGAGGLPRGLWPFAAAPARRALLQTLATGLGVMLLGLLVPVTTGIIVGTALPAAREPLLLEMVLLLAAAGLGVCGFAIARSLAAIRAATLLDLRLQAAVFDRLLRVSPGFFRRFSAGDLARRVLAVDGARQTLTGPVVNGLLGGAFAAMSLLLMLVYDLRLALFGLAFALAAVGLLALTARRQAAPLQRLFDAEGRSSGAVVALLSGIARLRVAAAEERAFARWTEAFAERQAASWQSGRIAAGRTTLLLALPSLGLLGMFLVAALRPVPVDLPAFAAFAAAFAQFMAGLAALGLALAQAVEALPRLRRALPILTEPPEAAAGTVDPGPLTGRIEVQDLVFRYASDRPVVLHGIDLAIEPGSFTAIAGPSGSGKSTLLRLLLGFERPESGRILYDGQDLARLDPRKVRRQVGTVLQLGRLVPGNLYENIAGGALLPEEAVLEAARLAGLEDEIAALPMGLETFVSEDGGTLSGGQRQRVLLARALVRRPPVLFLDEGTSALDNRVQALVAGRIAALGTTRLVIAHRLSTIRDADCILVMEGGRIVERGRHDELMAARGAFWRLARRQVA